MVENRGIKKAPGRFRPGALLLSNRVRRWVTPSTRRRVEQGRLLPGHTSTRRFTEWSTGADAVGHPITGHVTPFYGRPIPPRPRLGDRRTHVNRAGAADMP